MALTIKHLSEDDDDPFFGRWDKAAQYFYWPARLTCFLSDHVLKDRLNFFALLQTVLLCWFIRRLILNHSKCTDANFWVQFGTSLLFSHSSIALSQAQAFLAEHLCPMLFTLSFLLFSSGSLRQKKDSLARQYSRVRLESTHHIFFLSWAPCLFLCTESHYLDRRKPRRKRIVTKARMEWGREIWLSCVTLTLGEQELAALEVMLWFLCKHIN